MLFELNISKLDKTSGGDKQKDLFSLFGSVHKIV